MSRFAWFSSNVPEYSSITLMEAWYKHNLILASFGLCIAELSRRGVWNLGVITYKWAWPTPKGRGPKISPTMLCHTFEFGMQIDRQTNYRRSGFDWDSNDCELQVFQEFAIKRIAKYNSSIFYYTAWGWRSQLLDLQSSLTGLKRIHYPTYNQNPTYGTC